MNISVLDTTLRDGAQAAGISFSVQDKLGIIKILDQLGIQFIEAGNPASNQKEAEVFSCLKQLSLSHSKIVAFGSTRRKNTSVCEDAGIVALLDAGCEWVSVFGKSSLADVRQVLKTSADENLAMIKDTVEYLVANGRNVIYDAEHFFTAYQQNRVYALKTLETAQKAGAKVVCLCDTGGGAQPLDLYRSVCDVKKAISGEIGIHCHDDGGMAVANSMLAAEAGATHIQGTLLGCGERCGNANLSSVIPNLMLKKGYGCITGEQLNTLYNQARAVAEISNMAVGNNLPYIGRLAFAHKGGMHVDALLKNNTSYEHINPALVGNKRRILLSEYSGRASVLNRLNQINPELKKDNPLTNTLIKRIKQMEYEGYQFEGADASFELMVQRELNQTEPYFSLQQFKVIEEQTHFGGPTNSSAMIKILVGDRTELTVAEGAGPVEALDEALRKALEVFFPAISTMRLADYKVRVLDSHSAAASKVRVLIESTDGKAVWGTVGVSVDIIEASVIALSDSMAYKLYLDHKNQG